MGFLQKRKEKRKMKKQQNQLKSYLYEAMEYYIKQNGKYKWAVTGMQYYKGENDILKRKIYKSINGVKQEEPDVPNNKLAHPFIKKLVDQKVDYAFAKEPKYTCKDEKYLEWFTEWAEENAFNHWIKFAETLASNQGVVWVHPYINEAGEFKFVIIPATEIIPIWEDSLETHLKAVIRFYQVNQNNGFNGEGDTYLEYWTNEGMQRYMIQGNILALQNPNYTWLKQVEGDFSGFVPHYANGNTPKCWGKVPFIPLKNNVDLLPDLAYVKTLIDNYDFTRSDLANTLEELRNFIICLENAGGTSIKDILTNLKTYGVLRVPSANGQSSKASILSSPIDCNASETHSKILKNDIVQLLQSVDTMQLTQLPPSGASLQMLFTDLETKCRGVADQFKQTFRELQYFMKIYLTENNKLNPSSNIKAELVFNTVTNANEQADTMNKQADAARKMKGVFSDETIYKNTPFVDDIEKEKELMKAQNDDYFGTGNLKNKIGKGV